MHAAEMKIVPAVPQRHGKIRGKQNVRKKQEKSQRGEVASGQDRLPTSIQPSLNLPPD
jgi:hypothetical protein